MTAITSLKEYIEIVSDISKGLKLDISSKEYLFFRGQGSSNLPLVPRIGRYVKDNVKNSLLIYERDLVAECQRVSPSFLPEEKYPFNTLAKLQHYGVATRLLDVTKNSLVALYFACSNKTEKDGEVFIFKINSNIVRLFDESMVNAIAYTYTVPGCDNYDFKRYISEAIRKPYFKMCDINVDDENKLSKIRDMYLEHIFVLPKEEFQRQKQQDAAFIVFPNRVDGETMYGELLPIKRDDEKIKQIVKVNGESKQAILKELEACGINRQKLFADSIDIVLQEAQTEIEKLYDTSQWNTGES